MLEGHQGPVNAVASRRWQRLYSASADGTIGLWSAADGSFQRPLLRHGWGINVLARLPGGERLVYGGLNGTVAMVDGETGATVLELPPHERPVLSLAVLEKPGILATGGGDGVIRVLRAADGSLIEQYQNPYGPAWALAFVANSTALYYGGLDDFATLWRIAPREPFEAIDSPFPAPLPGARAGPPTRSPRASCSLRANAASATPCSRTGATAPGRPFTACSAAGSARSTATPTRRR